MDIKDITLVSYNVSPDIYTGWFRIRGSRGDLKVIITEYISKGSVIKYSYTLIEKEKPLLRYDNAPHHKDIETYPHHKHLRNKVYALYKSSVEDFLNEVKQYDSTE